MKQKKIGFIVLALFITGAIDSTRNLPSNALFGSAIPFLFITSAILFFIPMAWITAELSKYHSNEEDAGIYSWVRQAFGEKIAMLAIWLQWVNSLAWFPTILSFIAAAVSYLIDPDLIKSPIYIVCFVVFIFSIISALALRGVRENALMAAISCILGLIIPFILIITLLFFWISNPEHTSNIEFTWNSVIPDFSNSNNWSAITAVITAYLGIELAAVHIRHIKQPNKNFPLALFLSVFFILFSMITGSLAIAVIIPVSDISLVDGVFQSFKAFLDVYNLNWFMPILALMILVGSIGQMTNWLISPTQGLLMAAKHGFLPNYFRKTNKNNVPYRILGVQLYIVSFICIFMFGILPNINSAYWMMTVLSTQLYLMMYVIMLLASIRLMLTTKNKKSLIPFGIFGKIFLFITAFSSCIVAISVAFIPPTEINFGSVFKFEMIFIISLLLCFSPLIIFYKNHAKNKKKLS